MGLVAAIWNLARLCKRRGKFTWAQRMDLFNMSLWSTVPDLEL